MDNVMFETILACMIAIVAGESFVRVESKERDVDGGGYSGSRGLLSSEPARGPAL
jgi:hypothetical protein